MRVGVLEDDADHAVLITQALHADGHSTEVYATGARFLQAMVRETFDVLVLDWMLPDMTGIEILRRVKETSHLKCTPVVILTTTDD